MAALEPVHSGWKPSHSGGMLFDSIGVWKQTSSARWPFTLSFLQIEVMTFLVPLTKQTVLLGMRTTTNVCFPFLFFQYSPVFQSSRECSAPEKTVSKPALLSFCEIKWEWMSLDTYVSTLHLDTQISSRAVSVNVSSQFKCVAHVTRLERRVTQNPCNDSVNTFQAVWPKFVRAALQMG